MLINTLIQIVHLQIGEIDHSQIDALSELLLLILYKVLKLINRTAAIQTVISLV